MLRLIKTLLAVEALIVGYGIYYWLTYDDANLYGPAFGLVWPFIIGAVLGLLIVVFSAIHFTQKKSK